MDKIASPKELTSELRRVLAYASGEHPSRDKIASILRNLADRTAKAPKLPGSAERLKAEAALIEALETQYPDVDTSALRDLVRSAISGVGYKAKALQNKKDPSR